MSPRATMRLQFHKGFTFADAQVHVPYFKRLGISHIYASPITTARAGSMHGYDVIDPTRVNPELGGEEALRAFVSRLRLAGLGLIIDIVPNHMAATAENAWWFDVLRHGQQSRYAPYFDIDWNAEDEALRGKLLLPVLGKPLRDALRDKEITLERDGKDLVARYFDNRFPVSGVTPAEAERLSLDAVLYRQHYRLAWWRAANDTINWRRFFDINELIALNMAHEPAFDDAHALIMRLYAEGLIDGVRVDHIDGLSDPARYCRQLRARLDALEAQRPAGVPDGRAYLIVEKILLRGESLPGDWDTDGTSGYDFMNEVSAVQHDAAGEQRLNSLWASISGRPADVAIEEEAARREIIARSFSAQLEACARSFSAMARHEDADIGRAALRRALIELLAHFPIYRSYATANERPPRDAPFIAAAAEAATRTCLPTDRMVIDHLARWLRERCSDARTAALQDRAVTQLQQLSAPIAAKAVEDTAFYRYGRLLSRNDVGFDIANFSDGPAAFHRNAERRLASFPHAMLATATHDHKRGEDVRARLATLSEFANEWASTLPGWIERCKALCGGRTPSNGDIAMLLQMIVGAWPLGLHESDTAGRRAYAARLTLWQEKALREAKLTTDWTVPNDAYEGAARDLLSALLERSDNPTLLAEIAGFAARIAPAGAANALAQTLLKLTVPGVPDIYQGNEFWDFSLVDPDNRRPVDFAARDAGLDINAPLSALTAHWRDGRIKQALIARTLVLRARIPRVFDNGSYQPLTVSGDLSFNVIAFARRHADQTIVVVVPRAVARLVGSDLNLDGDSFSSTAITLPASDFSNVFDPDHVVHGGEGVPLGALLAPFPVALLVSPAATK